MYVKNKCCTNVGSRAQQSSILLELLNQKHKKKHRLTMSLRKQGRKWHSVRRQEGRSDGLLELAARKWDCNWSSNDIRRLGSICRSKGNSSELLDVRSTVLRIFALLFLKLRQPPTQELGTNFFGVSRRGCAGTSDFHVLFAKPSIVFMFEVRMSEAL